VSRAGDRGASLAIGEQPEVADADEAAREHVPQEAPHRPVALRLLPPGHARERPPAPATDLECDRLCNAKRISFKVVSCTEYADRRQASLREMEETAWVLRSDLKKGTIGFVKASALKPRERFVLPDDWD
jgi:hypothetical protein